MIISSKLTKKLYETEADASFLKCLDISYETFCKRIMMELTLFDDSPSDYGFSDLNLVTREYAVQKHFEKVIETYVREYLFKDVFEKNLEEKNLAVYRPQYQITEDEYFEDELFVSNKEFEANAGFELIIHDGQNIVGCRFTNIFSWDADKYFESGVVTEIEIIDWHNVNGLSSEEKQRKLYGMNENVTILGIKEFVGKWLGKAECDAYELFLRSAIQEYQDIIGISSIPKLTAPSLFEHRLDEECVLKNNINDMLFFSRNELESGNDTHFGYLIIEDDNKNEDEYKNLESDSKKLIIESGLLERYRDNKLYKALVGRGDFARSFLTSEYLYYQFNENDHFDYTAVVSGYLKSVEQLMLQIMLFYADKIDPLSNKLYRVGPPKKKTTITTEHYESGKLEKATMGNLIFFFRDYPDTLLISDEYKDIFYNCLDLYLDECRNQSFHKHNNYDWDRVNKIRHNTFVIYAILLGGCRLGDRQELVPETLHIITNDKLERVYYWLRTKRMYTFKIKLFEESSYYLATREAEEAFPVFDEYGLLSDDFKITVKCKKEDSNGGEPEQNVCFSRNVTPQELWYSTYGETYSLDIET